MLMLTFGTSSGGELPPDGGTLPEARGTEIGEEVRDVAHVPQDGTPNVATTVPRDAAQGEVDRPTKPVTPARVAGARTPLSLDSYTHRSGRGVIGSGGFFRRAL